jgi:hypothetical protein
MKIFLKKAVWLFILLLPLILAPPILANEPRVSIKVLSEDVRPGEEITIELTISHNANSYIHYVEWVEVLIYDLESIRWGYNGANLPPGPTFTKEYKYKVPDLNRIRIDAEASCVRHGSSGKVTLRVPINR